MANSNKDSDYQNILQNINDQNTINQNDVRDNNNVRDNNKDQNKRHQDIATTNLDYCDEPSVWFDELEVILPDQVAQSDLRVMINALQGHILQNDTVIDKKIADTKITDTGMSGNGYNNDEIGNARHILEHLLTTPIADASVLVAITNEMTPRLLLTRRAGHLNSHAGEVSFAGGKYEPEDGNNVVTALREACEETALPPNQVKIVGQLPIQTSKSGMSVQPILVLIEPDVMYVPELSEIERIFWADFGTLITQPTTDYEILYKQGSQTTTLLTPCWIIDNETVWGLTGRIIASLLEIAYGRETPWYYYPIEC